MVIKKPTLLLSAIIIGLGLLGAGYSIGKGIYLFKLMSRNLTVKGLAEQNVKSDLGIWQINYREIGNDLIDLNKKLQHDQELVTAFLKENGFADSEISPAGFKVEDRFANIYSQNTDQNANNPRYVVTGGVKVRSTNVEQIHKSAEKTDTLLQAGIPLAFDVSGFSPNPSYYFTGLDAIRPDMMAAATKSARSVAEQFAKDTDSELAGIQHASQGVFQIMSRDTSTMSSDWNSNENALGSIDKKVRLVTTLNYRLK